MRHELRISIAERTLLGVLIAWLVWSAATVNIEYYDGLSAVANARYFLGLAPDYTFDREPLMAWLLMPTEWLRARLGLHPLELRPHHAALALLHGIYLACTYALLVGRCGRSWTTLVAFAAAVPTFLFFSYAPFISHDLIPGLLLLFMIDRADRFAAQGRTSDWVWLVVVGTAAALVKQVFGLFWILVWLAHRLRPVDASQPAGASPRSTQWRLTAGMLFSGVATWVILGAVLAGTYPETSLLARPYRTLVYHSGMYAGTGVEFPIWVYIRNFPAYGLLAGLLVIPGIRRSLRGNSFQRDVAVVWLGGVIAMHLIPMREVRYLGFLAPLTACLIVPVIADFSRRPYGPVLLGALLAVDVARCGGEALRITHPFYSGKSQREFLEVLDETGARGQPVFVNAPMLSFVSPIPSPLAGDRNHRIFHFGNVHLQQLLGVPEVHRITSAENATRLAAICEEGKVFLYSSTVLARPPTWTASPPAGLDRFLQCAAVCRSDAIQWTNGDDPQNDRPDAVAARWEDSATPPAYEIEGDVCTQSAYGELYPVLLWEAGGKAFPLDRTSPRSFRIRGLGRDEIKPGERVELRRFVIDRRLVGVNRPDAEVVPGAAANDTE